MAKHFVLDESDSSSNSMPKGLYAVRDGRYVGKLSEVLDVAAPAHQNNEYVYEVYEMGSETPVWPCARIPHDE